MSMFTVAGVSICSGEVKVRFCSDPKSEVDVEVEFIKELAEA